jgi:hypothetical protein
VVAPAPFVVPRTPSPSPFAGAGSTLGTVFVVLGVIAGIVAAANKKSTRPYTPESRWTYRAPRIDPPPTVDWSKIQLPSTWAGNEEGQKRWDDILRRVEEITRRAEERRDPRLPQPLPVCPK